MSYHWSTHQLTEYLVSVSKPQNPDGSIVVALERAIEALDAELAAVVIDGEVRGSVGFGREGAPGEFVRAALEGDLVEVPGIGEAHVVRGELTKLGSVTAVSADRLIVGRLEECFTAEEDQLLRGMALVLGLVLDNLHTLQIERSRHQLVETLLEIQRAISAHRPLGELLDAITAGASALLHGYPIALLLSDPVAPSTLMAASVYEYPDLDAGTMAFVGEIVNGRTEALGQPPPIEVSVLAERVVVAGEIVGCLVARPDQHGARRREAGELLAAFAQQVSVALTDARALDALREAYHDSITGLPNRPLFLERLELARRSALAHGHDLTVLFIDIDRFKVVNDTLGHQVGDELLAEVGRRLARCIRPDDTAARLGGDEFAVLLDRISADGGGRLAGRVIDAFGAPFSIGGREVLVGASVGIASLTPTHESAGALLSDADVAMYSAKRSGRGQWVAFEPHMREEVVNRLNLRADLQLPHGPSTQTAPTG
jgi:diguanylate cyclase (GGDEF)-like protein